MSIKFSREMQLNRDDFLRELPAAVDQRAHEVVGNKVIVKDGDRRVEITLYDEGVRDMGSLHLPMEQVQFEFIGYSQEEVNAFMKRFDYHMLRMGGI